MRDSALFTPRRHASLTDLMVDDLRRKIVGGDLWFDSRLPSMRKLARLYGVGLPTVQAAIHALSALGFVRIVHGVGVFVTRPHSVVAALSHAWRHAEPWELGVIRTGIDERMAVALARVVAGRRSSAALPRSLGEVKWRALDRSHYRRGAAETFVRAEIAFHRSVVAAVPGSASTVAVYEGIFARLGRSLLAVAAGFFLSRAF